MKKILLLAALAAVCSGAQAETFTDLFKIQLGHKENGKFVFSEKEYAADATIDVTNYYDPMRLDYPDYEALWGMVGYMAECDVVLTNISDKALSIGYGYKFVDPAYDVFTGDENYGKYKICFTYVNQEGGSNCMTLGNGDITIQEPKIVPGGSIVLQCEQEEFYKLDPITVNIMANVYEGDKIYSEATSTLTLNYKHTVDESAAVASVGAAAGEASFFNLQGVKVASPEKGIYIKVENGKATKVIL